MTTSTPRVHVRRTAPGFKFVRVVKGGAVQARAHTGRNNKDERVNLGLFHARDYGSPERAHRAAQRAAFEFVKRAAGRDAWDVIRELQQLVVDGRPVVPPHVLPRWVYRHADGSGFGARVGKGGRVHLPGPYPDPGAAHRAMVAHQEAAAR